MTNYYEWDDFKNIYLEDSFVLKIQESSNELSFTLEIVLTEKHPFYVKPINDEPYCYKLGKISFKNCKSIKWLNRNFHPYLDSGGNIDYGNIDCLMSFGKKYYLEGDWGKVEINASAIEINWI